MSIRISMRGWLVVACAAALTMMAASPATAEGHKWRFSPTINAPWAHEEDEHPLDNPIDAAGLCRSSPFNLPNTYGPLGSNVPVIAGDAINNSGFSNFGCTTPQNETTIAVNPLYPDNLIAGANDYRVCCDFDGLNDATGWAYFSFDGGRTWGNVQLPRLTAQTGATGALKKFDSAGDPVVTFSPDGVAYYANIAFSRTTFASGIVVSSSTDGGRTWSNPSLIAFVDAGNFFNDKEWIAAGPNGRVIVTWTRFNLGPKGARYLASPIVGAISTDYGKTWNRQGFPVSDGAHPYNQGSQVAFAPDGALYVAYEGGSPATADAVVLARSTDDGRSFETKELARVYDDADCYPTYGGDQTLSDMHFRINSYPSMSIDAVTGDIAIVWADNQGSGTCGSGMDAFAGTTSSQVKLLQGGWEAIGTTAPTRITTSAPDKVFPSVAARNGKTVVTYYTRDYAIGSAAEICHVRTNDDGTSPGMITPSPSAPSVCIDYAAKSSADSFAAQTRLSTESSNPFIQFANGAFIGDYSQVALGSDGVAHAAWTDFRGRPGATPANQDVLVENLRP